MVDKSSETIAEKIAKAATDKKGQDISILDFRNFNTITDFFIIVSGNTKRQVDVIADNVIKELKKELKPLGIEGKSGDWVLIDFGDIIVHVMTHDMREYYQIERLWKDIPTLGV
ncbi:MAG: ribosome silencing factor [Actinobacteria bacterium]|nr:MAG: ribosome silencing factor [Actinomycetota bacterium]